MVRVAHERGAWRALTASLVGSLLFLAACGGNGASGPAATQSAASQAAVTQAAATQAESVAPSQAAGITDPSKLITSDEAATVLGGPITKTGTAIIDLYASPLTGFGFSLDASTSLAVGIITPETVNTACAPAKPVCPTWFVIKSSQPGGATVLPRIGDDAFYAKQGPSIFLVGAEKLGVKVFLFAQGKVTDATLEAMKTLLATAISRV